MLFYMGVAEHAKSVQKYQFFIITGVASNCLSESWLLQFTRQFVIQSVSQLVFQLTFFLLRGYTHVMLVT